MKNLLRRIASFHFGPGTFPLFLLALCLAAYSPLMTRLGFYWDDFPMNWIATSMGRAGLARYFSTNRPVWGLVYQITTALLGSRPLTWQIFALLLRWVSGLSLWALLNLLWRDIPVESEDAQQPRTEPQGPRGQFAAWAAALFVIYPGFSQQYIAFVYSHFFIILSAFLLSLALMLLALRLRGEQAKRWFWPVTAVSLLLSLLNLLSMEYFFLLDLLRPLLIWTAVSPQVPDRRKRLVRALRAWLPYLVVFAAAMFWRSVLFGFHTYQPALMSRLKAEPLAALGELIPLVLQDIWKTSAGAWAHAFTIPTFLEISARDLQRYGLFAAAGALGSILYLVFYRARAHALSPTLEEKSTRAKVWMAEHAWAWQPVGTGLLALGIAGGPFWLTDLQIGLVFPNDRFTLPFMLGASLVAAGLLALLPLPRVLKVSLLGLALGFAVGVQYQNAVVYRSDWSTQRSMFWQMVWRMPDLKNGTTLLTNELPVIHYTDNSLTAPLNWIYDPQNQPPVMNYVLLYPTLRKEARLRNFTAGQPVTIDYLAATFQGSTSQMVALVYNPPGCLRVLDPQIDGYNWAVPETLKESLSLTTTAPILAEAQAGKPAPRPPAQIYGEEITHGWCYYFEKGDLARQLGDWKTVAELGDKAFTVGDYPNDPLERFPFIEGYAHTGNWERAIQQTREANAFSPVMMQPMLCRLWDRVSTQTAAENPSAGDGSERQQAIQAIQTELSCGLAKK